MLSVLKVPFRHPIFHHPHPAVFLPVKQKKSKLGILSRRKLSPPSSVENFYSVRFH